MAKKKKITDDLKNFLNGARHWKEEADYLYDEIERLRSEAEKVTATFSDVPTFGGYEDHRQAKIVDMVQKQKEYKEALNKCRAHIQVIRFFIENLKSFKEREALVLYYVYCEDWDVVAQRMHYTERHVQNIHGKALLHLLDIHKTMIENGGKPLF